MPDWTASATNIVAITSDSQGDVYTCEQNFSTSRSDVESYEPTGTLKWSEDTDAAGLRSISVGNGEVYVGGDGGDDFYNTSDEDLSIFAAADGFKLDSRSLGNTYAELHLAGSTDSFYADDSGSFINYETGAQTLNPNGNGFSRGVFDGTYFWLTDGDYIYQVDESPTIVASKPYSDASHITTSANHIYVVAQSTIAKIDKSNLSIVWKEDYGESVFDIDYDDTGSRIYAVFGTGRAPLQIRDSDGVAVKAYNTAIGQENVTVNQGTTSVFWNGITEELVQVSDTEWEDRLITAAQTSTVATPNETDALKRVFATPTMNDAQVTAYQASVDRLVAQAVMNTESGVSASSTRANSVEALATMNTPAGTENIGSTQFAASATMLTGAVEEAEETWLILDAEGEEYLTDLMRLDDGFPQFRRGREITRTFLFTEDRGTRNHYHAYRRLNEKFNSYLTEDTIKMAITYDGRPHYTQNINPRSPATSYLWEVRPNPSIEGVKDWWVVVTDVEEASRLVGGSEALTVTMYVLAPTDEGDRQYIRDNFEV